MHDTERLNWRESHYGTTTWMTITFCSSPWLKSFELMRRYGAIPVMKYETQMRYVGLTDIPATRTVVIGTVAPKSADVTSVTIGSFLTAFRRMLR